MKCNFTDMTNISISIDIYTLQKLEIIMNHIGRKNRSWAVCEAIKHYASEIESNKMDNT